jgi:two-component sensor histidine kinase
MVYHFGLNDGLPEFVGFGHLACDEEGNMWYTTLYTVSKFPVNEMRFINEAPPVNIENVSLNMKETDWSRYSDSLSAKFQLPDNPVLKHFENTITISFKAVSMINNGGYQYSYMLYGLNNNWSGNSPNTTVTITKLKPGTYTFLVRAKRDNSDWGSPASFTFTISPAWWQKWWFTGLVILASICIIYLLYRIRISQLNKEKKIRDQIASDLHDDLGSTLNSVKVYANVASIEKDNKQYLEKIKESTQEAISSVRDIIWVLDEKKDTIEHLFTRISQFALPLSNANNIQFVQQIDNPVYNKMLTRTEKRNLFMIIKEAINNSIKYANCKTITLSAFEEKNKLVIQITDDGKGYDGQTIKSGHGIENIRKRSIEIHYYAKINSIPGKGTTIRLEKM